MPDLIPILVRGVDRITRTATDRLHSVANVVRLRLRGVQVGRGLRAYGPLGLNISPSATVSIGHDVLMNSGSVNAVGASQHLSLVATRGAHLTIGDRVGMSNCCIFASKSVTIETEATIGGGVAIYDTDFHSIRHEERLRPIDRTVRSAPVVIGARSFIGAHSVILKGVHVGEGSVVGAGSVLRKSIPPYQIWAGNPARYIRPVPGHEVVKGDCAQGTHNATETADVTPSRAGSETLQSPSCPRRKV